MKNPTHLENIYIAFIEDKTFLCKVELNMILLISYSNF